MDKQSRKELILSQATTDSPQLQVVCVSTREQFDALKSEWDALAETQVKTIFLTHDWLDLWWQFYGAHFELWTLTVREAGPHGRLIGILPLILKRDGAGFRRLMFMGAGEVTPNHLDVIAYPDLKLNVLRALAIYLRRVSNQWDILQLDKVPADSYTVKQFPKLLGNEELTTWLATSAQCPFVELPDSFEAFLQSRGSSTRRNFRHNLRLLERNLADARFVRVQTDAELDIAFTALVRLHQSRWTQKGYPGAFSNERFVGFHRVMAKRALRTNHLRFYYLQIGSDIAATKYCYRVAESVQFYQKAFDDRWQELSLGFVMDGYAIQQSIIEGARQVDFLEGTEPHKEAWSTGVRDNVCLHAYSPHWRGKVSHWRARATARLVEWSMQNVPLEIRRPIRQAVLRLRRSSPRS